MGKAIIRISGDHSSLNFPSGTKVEGIRSVFDEPAIELRVDHPSLPEVVSGCPIMRMTLVNTSDGKSWFA